MGKTGKQRFFNGLNDMTLNLFMMCLYDGLDHGLCDKSVQSVASTIYDGFYVRPLASSSVY